MLHPKRITHTINVQIDLNIPESIANHPNLNRVLNREIIGLIQNFIRNAQLDDSEFIAEEVLGTQEGYEDGMRYVDIIEKIKMKENEQA